MASKVREIAAQWRELAGTLGIPENEIEEPNENLCIDEKCFLLFIKWQETAEVTLPMLTLFLTSMGFGVTAGEFSCHLWKQA